VSPDPSCPPEFHCPETWTIVAFFTLVAAGIIFQLASWKESEMGELVPILRFLLRRRISQVAIPVLVGVFATMIYAQDYPLGIFVLWLTGVWGIGAWLVSEELAKKKPVKSKASATSRQIQRKNADKRRYLYWLWTIPSLILIACVIVNIVVIQRWDEYKLAQHGDWLVPASDPEPHQNLLFPCPIPRGAVKVLLGNNVAYASEYPASVIDTQNISRLYMRRDEAGRIAVTGDIFDSDDNVVVEIKDNHFTVATDVFEMGRPDPSTLSVTIRKHKEHVLTMRFMNPDTVRITGIFRYLNVPPITVTDESVTTPPNNSAIFDCFEIGQTAGAFSFNGKGWVQGEHSRKIFK
jgi:hypothetical protein